VSEPALKKQKLDADELCTCTSLIDAAEHQRIKCVAKYITDINNAGIKASVLLSGKHESKESQHKGCTECLTALLAAGTSAKPLKWCNSAVAVAADAGCVPCLTVLLAHADSLTCEAQWPSALKHAISTNSVEIVQMLLDAAPAHMSRQLLQVALLDVCGLSTSDCQRRTSLMEDLLARGACVNSLSSYYVHKQLETRECTALGVLAQVGCCADIELLVATHKADVNLKFGDSQCTALHVACVQGTSEQQEVAAVVQKLVELGADLNAVTADSSTVLHLAVKTGSLAALRALAPLLLAAAANGVQANLLACTDSSGCTPLHVAVLDSRNAEHCREVLEVLLSLYPEHVRSALAKADKQGNTAMHIAIEQHKFALLQQLLDASSNLGCVSTLLSSIGAAGADCWLMARRAGVAVLAELLAPYATAAATAATAGDSSSCATTAAGGSSSSALTAAGATVRASCTASDGDLDCINVHTALSKAHNGCLKLLLARSPSAAAEITGNKQTALHLVDHDKPHCDELTATLLSACPSDELHSIVNTADASGQTPLQLCVRDAHWDSFDVCHRCMRALLAAGAAAAALTRYEVDFERDLSLVDYVLHDDALSPLQSEAALAESISTVQALLAVGCSTQAQLCRAVACPESRAAVRVLLACGADPFERDEDGRTAMHCAASYSSYDVDSPAAMADELAAVPANVLNIQDLHAAAGAAALLLVNSTDHKAFTALHSAVHWPVAVRALLQRGAVVDLMNADSCTALHLACKLPDVESVESVELLLAAGSNVHALSMIPNSQTEGLWLPLHYAVTGELYDSDSSAAALQIVVLLLSHGASINALTTRGCSALWLVVRHCTHRSDGHLRVRGLVKLGAAVDFYSEVHGSLLHAVAASGRIKVLKELLDSGVMLDDSGASARNARLETPLHIAARAGHTAVLR
jgi:ankyrin repeat protein